MRKIPLVLVALLSIEAFSAPQDHGVDYDIIYVRYPNADPNGDVYVDIPQGEHAYTILPGADLMRLKPDGTTEVLIDCTDCSVMDPYISYDGTTVYYSKIINIPTSPTAQVHERDQTPGYIYKMDVSGTAPYTEVQLTFPGDFDHAKYAANTDPADNPVTPDYGRVSNIRDMAPVPLSDGRLMFTSNRHAITGFKRQQNRHKNMVQMLYTMDDHDGTANTPELSNMHRIEKANLRMAQHPMQLKDGRILYTGWVDVANKWDYAMSELMTMHPDGSNQQQFTEPHDHKKNLNHFITQLANEDVVVVWYYPSFDYGYGVLTRYDVAPHNGDFLRTAFSQPTTYGGTFGSRLFDRPNSDNLWIITPHSTNRDVPAITEDEPGGATYGDGRTGKYSYPSWGKSGHMLVSYSLGYVNHFRPPCKRIVDGVEYNEAHPYPAGSRCEPLKAGIWLMKNAETAIITDPTDSNQLALMYDDTNWNEIWPRALVPYNDVFGQSAPDILPSTRATGSSEYLAKGEAAGILGTSSMSNRESSFTYNFNTNTSRDSGNVEEKGWKIRGTDVGVYTESDIYGVRIISTPEVPFTSEYAAKNNSARDYVTSNTDRNNKRFGSSNNEQWKILAEFPLTNKATTDVQGNPDTSWWAKIPADTPTLIQAIDINGMTLNSELVWRTLAPGEQRTDCGGCHAHSTLTTPLDFSTTQAGQNAPIQNVAGLDNNDPLIRNNIWDFTQGRTTLIKENGGVDVINQGVYSVEFERDIMPIFAANCNSCHTSGGNNGGLVLDDADTFYRIANSYSMFDIRRSKYIRSSQARESLLVWVAWGQRLDGRTNATFPDDYDYPDAHPVVNLTFDEKRKIARWVDLGSVANLPDTFPQDMQYVQDNQLPYIHIYSPEIGSTPANNKIRIGVKDADSGINWGTVTVQYYDVSTPGTVITISNLTRDSAGVLSGNMPTLTLGNDYVLTVTAYDVAGNKEQTSVRFTYSAAETKPASVQSLGAVVSG